MKTAINPINSKLTSACQQAEASCCKTGLLFLPEDEHKAIISWLTDNSPSELDEFESRCVKHDGFYLYDQKDCCQFLTETNLCRLHLEGVKPSECFWWPVQIYGTEPENLEFRVATRCCTACEYIDPNSSLLDDITKRVSEIGSDVFCRFRRVYLGNSGKRFYVSCSCSYPKLNCKFSHFECNPLPSSERMGVFFCVKLNIKNTQY